MRGSSRPRSPSSTPRPDEIARQSARARAWRSFDHALNPKIADAALAAKKRDSTVTLFPNKRG
jgi:hypothetical protein